jgi:hypothetical protein
MDMIAKLLAYFDRYLWKLFYLRERQFLKRKRKAKRKPP